MSCSCCCCESPSREQLDGVRRKELLLRQEEEEEQSRRSMDISLLREQYRTTREAQRSRTQVLLLRTVSEDLSEAVSVVPVSQSLTSPWEPNSSSPPTVTFDPVPTACDPWHLHLGLHRRCRHGVTAQLTASPPETTNTNNSSRRSSFSSESVDRKLSVDSTSDSPCSSFCSTKEEECQAPDRCRDPDRTDPADPAEQSPRDGPGEDRPAGSEDSSTPVGSLSCSPSGSTSSLHRDAAGRTGRTGPEDSACRGRLRKFSAPALKFTRQLSVGGVGSSTGSHQNQNYHPFPNRKPPRISEAARRLGMYSSF